MDGQVVINTKLNDEPLKNGIKNIEGVTKNALASVKKALVATGLTVGVTALVSKVNQMVKSTAQLTDRVDKQSQKIGLSRKAFQEWDYILSQSGTSVDGLQMSMKTLSTVVDEAERGNKTYIETLDRLGVTTKDSTGKAKSQEQMLNDVFSALARVENQTERTALASRLLGRSATELAPALNSGAESIEELREEAYRLGLVLDDATIDAGVKLTDTMDNLKRATQNAIARAFTPLLEETDNIQKAIIDKIIPAFENFITGAIDMLPKVKAVGEFIVEVIGIVAKYLKLAFDDAVTFLKEHLFEPFMEWFVEFWANHGEAIMDLLGVIWDNILQGIDVSIENIKSIIKIFGMVFKGDWEGIWEEVKSIFSRTWEAIVRVLDTMLEAIFNLFGVDWENLKEKIVTLPSRAKDAFLDMKDRVVEYVKDMVEAIQDWFSETKLGKAFSWVGEQTKKVTGFFADMWDKVVGHSYVPDMVEEIGDAFSKLVEKMNAPAKEATDEVSKDFNNMADNVGRAVNRLAVFDEAKKGFKNFMDGIKEEYKDVAGFVERSLNSMVGTLQTGFADGIKSLTYLWINQKDIIAGLNEDIEAMQDTLKDSYEDLEDAQRDYSRAVLSGDSKAIRNAERRVKQQEKLIKGHESQLKALKDEKASVEDGSKAWGDFAKVIIQALANTMYGLGAELAARAILAGLSFNWGGAALAGAGSVAAFAAGAALDSWAGSFAEGGIVPQVAGVPSFGDRHLASVNPGELILNASQQQNLAGQLAGVTINIETVYGLDSDEVGRAVYRNIKSLQSEGVLSKW